MCGGMGIYFQGVYLRYVFDFLKLRNFQRFVKDVAAIDARGYVVSVYIIKFVCLYDILRGDSLLVSTNRVMRRPQEVERAE